MYWTLHSTRYSTQTNTSSRPKLFDITMSLITTSKTPPEPKNVVLLYRIVTQWYDGGTNRMNGAAEAEPVTENPGRRRTHRPWSTVAHRAHPCLVGVLVRHHPTLVLPAANKTAHSLVLRVRLTILAVARCGIASSAYGGLVRIRNTVACR